MLNLELGTEFGLKFRVMVMVQILAFVVSVWITSIR